MDDDDACVASPLATRRTHLAGWSLALGALLLATGCSDVDHGDRAPLTGTVTVQGQPLDVKATIYFDPMPGQEGVGSSAEVASGKFTMSAETGPTPGQKYNVTVTTVPGIPAENTPRDQIKVPQTYKKVVEVPKPGEDEQPVDLKIDFDAPVR
jgi:hypothetical protein